MFQTIKKSLSIFILRIAIKFIISALTITNVANAIAQDRNNRPQLEMHPVAELKKAKGWILNPDGQWESGNNKIPWRLEGRMSTLKSVPKYSLGTDNFKSYKFYSAKIGGKKFAVFVKSYTTGKYAYENIQTGWYDGPHTQAYAIELSEIKKLSVIEDGAINNISLKAFDFKYISMENDIKSLSIIKTTLGFESSKLTPAVLFFQIAPYQKKGITQFNIFNKIYVANTDIETGTRDNPYVDGELVFGSKNSFRCCYFESSNTEFSKFIKKTLEGLAI